jgi:hypothetical protein
MDKLAKWYTTLNASRIRMCNNTELMRYRDQLLSEQIGTEGVIYTQHIVLTYQPELFRQIKLENEELRAKQKAYETDLKVWRSAVEQAEEKVVTTLKSMHELQREVNVVKVSTMHKLSHALSHGRHYIRTAHSSYVL